MGLRKPHEALRQRTDVLALSLCFEPFLSGTLRGARCWRRARAGGMILPLDWGERMITTNSNIIQQRRGKMMQK